MLLERPMNSAKPVVWYVDNLTSIAQHPISAIGQPSIRNDLSGANVSFDGVKDGLMVENNPIAGLQAFTVEVLFFPANGGAFEQRFIHLQEHASESRALVELRSENDNWYLDTYLHAPRSQLTLITPKHLHPHDQWYFAALTYDGTTMRHFVDAKEEASGRVSFAPLGTGRASIGVRQNQVSWFRGAVREIRIWPLALEANQLQRSCRTG